MDQDRMTALKDAFMSMTPDEEQILNAMLQQRQRQAEAQALAAQLPDRGPTFTYLTRKKFCPETGTPLISLQVICPDGGLSPEYFLEVATAEGLAQHLLVYASEHRQKYPADWFNDSVVGETTNAVPENG